MKRQIGQGLVESLFAVSALLLMACAIAWVGSAQHRAMQVSQDSRAAAFAAARGYAPPARYGDARLSVSRDRPGGVPADSRQAQLQQDWLRIDTKLVTINAERIATPVAGGRMLPIGDVVLRRHTSVAQVGGHAVSDVDGQQRLLGSALGWGQAADASLALAHRLTSQVAGIEGAWGNRKPDLDWVSIWSNLVPTDKLTKGNQP